MFFFKRKRAHSDSSRSPANARSASRPVFCQLHLEALEERAVPTATPYTVLAPAFAGPATHFQVIPALHSQAGKPTPVLVVALNAANYPVVNYSGTVHLTSNNAGDSLPADFTFTGSQAGNHLFQLNLASTAFDVITANDTLTPTVAGAAAINVLGPQVATHFVVLPPSQATSGQHVGVVVFALDASNHVVPGYTGTVEITTSDASPHLPADYKFSRSDHGVHTFPLTLTTTGAQTITATDTLAPMLTGSATETVTSASVVTHFAVISQPVASSGTSFNVYVYALDSANHVVPGYTGTVHFTSSDGSAHLPADYTFTASDSGLHVFSISLASKGKHTITMTDTTTSSITDTSPVFVTELRFPGDTGSPDLAQFILAWLQQHHS